MQKDQTTYILDHALTVMIIGLTGGATWLALAVFADFPAFLGLWDMIRLTTATALAGGAVAVWFFGRDGLGGIGLALLGGLIATSIGATLAVGVVESVELALWGPVMVVPMLVVNPAVGGVWVLGMLAAHLCATSTLSPENSDCP